MSSSPAQRRMDRAGEQVESAAAPFAESAPSRHSDRVHRPRQASRATSRPDVRTTAALARAMGRRFVRVDSSAEAAELMRARLGGDRVVYLDATGSELEQHIC